MRTYMKHRPLVAIIGGIIALCDLFALLLSVSPAPLVYIAAAAPFIVFAALAALNGKWISRAAICAFVLMIFTQAALYFAAVKADDITGAAIALGLFAVCGAGLYLCLRFQRVHWGYMVLFPMSAIWLFPIFWILMTSFRAEKGSYSSYFIPRTFTLDNYIKLLTDNTTFEFTRWFGNTLFVAVCACLLTSFIVLSTAFVLSRLRFTARKGLMNVLLILGMFPGFMSMIAVYYILKGIGLTQQLTALILVYGGGGALGYYIAKGFFDTIPKSLDEAALLDGATKWQLFTRITIPLSKPIIIYTMLIAFIAPWADLIFAQIIMGDNYKNWTIAVGMFTMLERANIDTWYTRFAAGSVLISIPIAVLFVAMQRYYVEGLSGSVKG